jgi:hypothetical protein
LGDDERSDHAQPRTVSRLNHDRPVFKVIDAGGGERIRTIAEDFRSARAEDWRKARRPAPRSKPPSGCADCGTTKAVQPKARRCAACLADVKRVVAAQQRLKSVWAATGVVEAAEGEKQRLVIHNAKTRIAKRRRANSQPVVARRRAAGASAGARTTKPNVKAAERAAEATRKELLLARTDWEKQLLRERHRRAQEALTRAQRLDAQRRSLS